jgi:hypothetical protein
VNYFLLTCFNEILCELLENEKYDIVENVDDDYDYCVPLLPCCAARDVSTAHSRTNKRA